ncbi:hypothetical protein MTO96_021134 [Rhipicephalus appendiculatus]
MHPPPKPARGTAGKTSSPDAPAASGSTMVTATHVEELAQKPQRGGGVNLKLLHTRQAARKRRAKASPRPDIRFRGLPHHKGQNNAGLASDIQDAIKGWLPELPVLPGLQGYLFEQGHKKGPSERPTEHHPNAEAARRAAHRDVGEHTTMMEMRQCAIEGDATPASGAGKSTDLLQQMKQPAGPAESPSSTTAKRRSREAADAAASATRTTDTAASEHRSVAHVTPLPVAGRRRSPAVRQARPRATGRRPPARVNTCLQSCMFVLSGVIVILILPALAILKPYSRGAGAAAAEVAEEALETVEPVLAYKLPREQASNCIRRRHYVIGASLRLADGNGPASASKTTLKLPVIRRRRLVCLYKAGPDAASILDDLYRICTDVAYGQFYVDKAGPTLDHVLPDKSLYPHVPRVLGWLGGDLNDAGDFSRLANESPKTLQGFAENFVTWLGQWSFDGAHVDWRYPGGPCDVADDYRAFVRLLQLLRKKTSLLSVAIAYKDVMLVKRYDIKTIASLADMLVVNTDEEMAEDNTGEPSCAGATSDAASLVYYRTFAQPFNKSTGPYVLSSVIPYSDHCMKKPGYRNQPLFNEPGCTALVRGEGGDAYR